MNDETYEALKRVIKAIKDNISVKFEDIKQVEDWIDEVAKDYNEGGAMFD